MSWVAVLLCPSFYHLLSTVEISSSGIYADQISAPGAAPSIALSNSALRIKGCPISHECCVSASEKDASLLSPVAALARFLPGFYAAQAESEVWDTAHSPSCRRISFVKRDLAHGDI